MPEPGLCSAALEEELLGELRRHGIVVWLDKDAAYSAFVDALQRRAATGSFAYPVVAFRGSFLQTVLALEPYGNSLDKSPLLIHMPGFNEESIRRTPVLELYEAGYRFRKSLDTLVQEVARGRVTPAELQELLAQPGLTLHTADAWLAQRLSESREGLAGLLAQMSLGVVVDELLVKDTFLLGRLRSAQECEVLKAYLQRQLGIDEPWHQFIASHDPQSTPEKRLAAALAAWLLCVEYVHDLKRPPHLLALQPLRALSPLLVEPCVAQVHALRSRHADLYARLADEVETNYLFEELPAIRPEDLGQVDTFPIEETRVLEAAIAALKAAKSDDGPATELLHFGLGSATEASKIHILWPGGAVQDIPGPIAGDRVVENVTNADNGGWSDEVRSSVNFSLYQHVNIEVLRLTGTLDISGTGNSGHNFIYGNDGNNGRFGSARNFTLSAAAGADPAAASFAYRAPADGRVDIRV